MKSDSAVKYAPKCQEKFHGETPYCVCFNLIDPRREHVFATVGDQKVRIFEVEESSIEGKENSPSFKVLQEYEEKNERENLFTCAWSMDAAGDSLLCFGGQLGIVKVINIEKKRLEKVLPGHGNSINELKSHPTKPALILSASKDESIRIWNIQTGAVVMIFAGLEGHRSDVLSADFHQLNGERLVSGGIDNTVKIWDLQGNPRRFFIIECL